jgi:hypothetical protein
MPPDEEPVDAIYHKSTWTYCQRDGSILVCEDRMNINGIILRKGAVKWELPTASTQ